MRQLIVGIDAGITTGLAILSVRGELLELVSKRNASMDWLIRTIRFHGSPLILCTDTSKPSRVALSLNSKFKCLLFSPPEDLKRMEKSRITYSFELENAHERDALAAAFTGYKQYKPLINRVLRKTNPEEFEKVLRTVLLTGKNIQRTLKED